MSAPQHYAYEDPEVLAIPEPTADVDGYAQDHDHEGDLEDGEGYTYADFVAAHGAPGAGAGEEEEEEDDEEKIRLREEEEEERKKLLAEVPEEVKKFIVAFHQAILANDTSKILYMYESGWNKLTHQHFSAVEWPEAEIISSLVQHDHVFLTLYRELYFRHVYARLEPNIDDRFNSYENICDFFNLLLNSEQPVPLDLPIQWLWDMLDEFVYQFQSFAQWRVNVKAKSEDELQMLAQHPMIWSCYSVLNVLYSLVQRSNISEQLKAEKEGKSAEEIAEIAGDYGTKPLYRNLGYFSLICLLRVQVLLGDPTLAIQTIENIDLSSNAILTKITACHVTTYYHIGFAYMQLGRYPDAIKTFVSVLIYFNRMKQYHTRSYQYGSINRQCERMYALLAICTTLSPGPTDEGIMSLVKERHSEQLATIQRGGEEALAVYRELFLGACPKFLSQIAPPYENAEHLAVWTAEPPTDAYTRQVDLFLSDVAPLLNAPSYRSFLKLYTSIDAAKMASFMDSSEDEVLEKMMLLKSASRTYGHREGNLLNAERMVTNALDFYVEGETVQVAETTTNRRFAGFFIRNAENAQKVFDNIRHAPLPITKAPAAAGATTAANTTPSAQRPTGPGRQQGSGANAGARSSAHGRAWGQAARGGAGGARPNAWGTARA